jgi:hypothetical protein
MTGNIWIDLQLSLADIEADLPECELPRIPTVGNAMGQRGLKGAIDDALNLDRMPQDHADSEDWLAVDQSWPPLVEVNRWV